MLLLLAFGDHEELCSVNTGGRLSSVDPHMTVWVSGSSAITRRGREQMNRDVLILSNEKCLELAGLYPQHLMGLGPKDRKLSLT